MLDKDKYFNKTYTKIYNDILDSPRLANMNEAVLYGIILSCTLSDGNCHMALSTLAKKIKVAKKSLIAILQRLIDKGLVEIYKGEGYQTGKGPTNKYIAREL